MFIGKYNKSVIVTYLGVISGIFGMTFAMKNKISYSMICLIISGICDLFDGKIARMCKRDEEEKEFGIQLDSLADTFLFLGLPTVIGMKLFEALPVWFNVVFILYVIAGIIRLAWFNIIADKNGPVKYYTGLPVTFVSFIFPIVYTFSLLFNFSITYIFAALYAIIAFLFILNVKIPKPTGIWYAIFSVMAIAAISVIIIWG